MAWRAVQSHSSRARPICTSCSSTRFWRAAASLTMPCAGCSRNAPAWLSSRGGSPSKPAIAKGRDRTALHPADRRASTRKARGIGHPGARPRPSSTCRADPAKGQSTAVPGNPPDRRSGLAARVPHGASPPHRSRRSPGETRSRPASQRSYPVETPPTSSRSMSRQRVVELGDETVLLCEKERPVDEQFLGIGCIQTAEIETAPQESVDCLERGLVEGDQPLRHRLGRKSPLPQAHARRSPSVPVP